MFTLIIVVVVWLFVLASFPRSRQEHKHLKSDGTADKRRSDNPLITVRGGATWGQYPFYILAAIIATYLLLAPSEDDRIVENLSEVITAEDAVACRVFYATATEQSSPVFERVVSRLDDPRIEDDAWVKSIEAQVQEQVGSADLKDQWSDYCKHLVDQSTLDGET